MEEKEAKNSRQKCVVLDYDHHDTQENNRRPETSKHRSTDDTHTCAQLSAVDRRGVGRRWAVVNHYFIFKEEFSYFLLRTLDLMYIYFFPHLTYLLVTELELAWKGGEL